MEVGADARRGVTSGQLYLSHVAFKIGANLDASAPWYEVTRRVEQSGTLLRPPASNASSNALTWPKPKR